MSLRVKPDTSFALVHRTHTTTRPMFVEVRNICLMENKVGSSSESIIVYEVKYASMRLPLTSVTVLLIL